jgi:hypothetical protein
MWAKVYQLLKCPKERLVQTWLDAKTGRQKVLEDLTDYAVGAFASDCCRAMLTACLQISA